MKQNLTSQNNPDKRRDYVVSLSKVIEFTHEAYVFTLRYVPDKLILQHEGFEDYLDRCQILEWNTPEGLALHILEDVMDEIVPKWVGVSICHDHEENGLHAEIIVEDRQPDWTNDALLKRFSG